MCRVHTHITIELRRIVPRWTLDSRPVYVTEEIDFVQQRFIRARTCVNLLDYVLYDGNGRYYWNSRPLNVASVLPDHNYEATNASACQISTYSIAELLMI